MAYSDVLALHEDPDFAGRTQACVAIETLGDDPLVDPGAWQAQHAWEMAAQPGFGDAYASALAADPPIERPGNDTSVISDAQILSAVQSVMA